MVFSGEFFFQFSCCVGRECSVQWRDAIATIPGQISTQSQDEFR